VTHRSNGGDPVWVAITGAQLYLCPHVVASSVPLPKAHPTPPNKDGGTLRTVLDARAYMLRLSKDRERSARWQRAAQLLLAKADVGAVSRQLELALLYDGKLDVGAMG
jgi:hypothetical protein